MNNEQVVEKVTVNVREMAKMLGISVPRAYDLTKRKGFPAIRVSERRIIIPVDGLRRWLDDPSNMG